MKAIRFPKSPTAIKEKAGFTSPLTAPPARIFNLDTSLEEVPVTHFLIILTSWILTRFVVTLCSQNNRSEGSDLLYPHLTFPPSQHNLYLPRQLAPAEERLVGHGPQERACRVSCSPLKPASSEVTSVRVSRWNLSSWCPLPRLPSHDD